MNEPTYLYGWGSKKHIAADGHMTLCGNSGYDESWWRRYRPGEVNRALARPLCKACEKSAGIAPPKPLLRGHLVGCGPVGDSDLVELTVHGLVLDPDQEITVGLTDGTRVVVMVEVDR